MKSKGQDWSEWELVKAARPRFPGHHQPNVPLWGYTDESDPKAMEQKIAAADYGIDAFLFDWYYYNDGPTKRRLLSKPGGTRILNINCWNEWTEGSYVEPDQRSGMKYLEAIREVFGIAPAAKVKAK